jgi:hypothetical protein
MAAALGYQADGTRAWLCFLLETHSYDLDTQRPLTDR